jgi:hypothetical protein
MQVLVGSGYQFARVVVDRVSGSVAVGVTGR